MPINEMPPKRLHRMTDDEITQVQKQLGNNHGANDDTKNQRKIIHRRPLKTSAIAPQPNNAATPATGCRMIANTIQN